MSVSTPSGARDPVGPTVASLSPISRTDLHRVYVKTTCLSLPFLPDRAAEDRERSGGSTMPSVMDAAPSVPRTRLGRVKAICHNARPVAPERQVEACECNAKAT